MLINAPQRQNVIRDGIGTRRIGALAGNECLENQLFGWAVS